MSVLAIKDKKIVTLFVTALALIAVYIFNGNTVKINNSIQNVFYQIKGEETPDSNIILIHITSSDIENLGDWPLKRSYYALLVQNLTKLKVKKIGIEVFISENITSQSLYNSVLSKTIRQSKNVVLSSIAENIYKNKNEYLASSISLSVPAKKYSDINSGHINILLEDNIVVPNNIKVGTNFIKSFSSQLSDAKNIPTEMKINFSSSWKRYTSYSLLEFFGMVEQNNVELNNFKNKIIIIGVSDPLIAKTITTGFDSELPGVGLHAIALNNINNKNWIDDNYLTTSFLVFGLLALLGVFLVNTKTYFYFGLWAFILLLSYFLFGYLQISLNYLAFVLPAFIGGALYWFLSFFENKKQLSDSITETKFLKHSLAEEEKSLTLLKEKLITESGDQREVLLNKIKVLEGEVEGLKLEEKEDVEAFVQNTSVNNFEGIIYRSKKMGSIVNLIKKVAPENATVLIMGKSGSGKELVANAIHNLSKRKDEKIVIVNCAALPDNLLESELFGHVKGAFTDAIKDKIGRFEEANNGTLFLDEIGETSENFQVKLLRVLQSGDFQKVGSSQTIHADVRIVAATNKNLKDLVSKGKFREDLYYRLNVIVIELPSLNDKVEDVEILADYFVKKENENLTLSKAVMNKLTNNKWKGNVRELESVIKRAAIFAKSENREIVKLVDLPIELAKHNKSELENMILESLREKKFSHSSINETAKEVGDLSRTIISENFRGIFFRYYCENNYDLEKAVEQIAETNEESVNEKVKSKCSTYLSNIEKDLTNHSEKTFEEVKTQLASKYKNLPQKYHTFLDKVIKRKM
ncbi:MAG: sigma 54-interacting transcriptional regulator [Melioribacteraceae bacterium]